MGQMDVFILSIWPRKPNRRPMCTSCTMQKYYSSSFTINKIEFLNGHCFKNILPPSQIVNHSRNLRESKHFHV